MLLFYFIISYNCACSVWSIASHTNTNTTLTTSACPTCGEHPIKYICLFVYNSLHYLSVHPTVDLVTHWPRQVHLKSRTMLPTLFTLTLLSIVSLNAYCLHWNPLVVCSMLTPSLHTVWFLFSLVVMWTKDHQFEHLAAHSFVSCSLLVAWQKQENVTYKINETTTMMHTAKYWWLLY